jgi:hypothetical protein
MDFQLKEILDAIGPTASLMFASWIFLSFLEQRYVSAFDRYRALSQAYRKSENLTEKRMLSLKAQVILYKVRCEQMKRATNLGIFAAICLTLTLVCGVVQAVFKDLEFIKYIALISSLLGFSLVIFAAIYVFKENMGLQKALDIEVSDLKDIAEVVHVKPLTEPPPVPFNLSTFMAKLFHSDKKDLV